jgi:hypothetical protein
VRLPRVVACAALIAVLASVVVPGPAGSRNPSLAGAIDHSAYRTVDLTTMTIPAPDPAIQSDGRIDAATILREPQSAAGGGSASPDGRPDASIRQPAPLVRETWTLDNNISWYGPGFYGNGGACGMLGPDGLTKDTVGVAHRTLPCGTKVTFRYNGVTVTAQVIDRGPYVAGRTWDMTHGLCEALHHCFTGGGVYYRIG